MDVPKKTARPFARFVGRGKNARTEGQNERVVDFFAHLIFGEIDSSAHVTAPQRVFESVARRVEHLESKLGKGSVAALFGSKWTDALKTTSDSGALSKYRGAYFGSALLYLDAALGDRASGQMSLNGAAVGAIVAGRHAIGTDSKLDGQRSLRDLREATFADDGTYQRLVEGLTVIGPRFDESRSVVLRVLHGPKLPSPSHKVLQVAPLAERDSRLPNTSISHDDLQIVGPIGAGSNWIEQLTEEAKAVPLAAGRNEVSGRFSSHGLV